MRFAGLVHRRAGDPVRPELVVAMRLTVLLAVTLWAVLPPLAAASPPDPTWIAGFYDDADFDDIVVHIGLMAGVCDPVAPPALAPDSLVCRVLPGPRQPLLRLSRTAFQGRAPPLV